MAQIQKKFIANAAVDETKILLSNTGVLLGRNAANSANIGILQVAATDRIVFSSVPQTTSDALVGNDLVRFSQLAALTEGLKPKQAVAAASTVNVNLASAVSVSPMDGYTILNGDRILLKDQTAPAENGIYVATTATNPTTWVRSADFNAVSEIPGAYTVAENGTISQGILYVTTSTPAVLGTDPILFTFRPTAAALTGGDMITVSGGAISVDLATVSGLVSTNPGNAAGQLQVKLEAVTPTLQIDGSNQLGIKLNASGGIVTSASGINIQLEASNPSLQIATNQLGVKLNAAGAIVTGVSGVSINVDGISTTITSNLLRGLIYKTQVFTLSSTDITNQYVDLAQAIATLSSVSLNPAGGTAQVAGVDFSASQTGGVAGVGRVTFLGDLATGGAAALVAGDVITIGFSRF